MSDVKDILGVPRDGSGAAAAPVPKKEKLKRPEGMSREAFALLSGGLNPLAPTALAEQLKKKDFKQLAKSKRTSSKGVVTYQWMPFDNAARSDGLQLKHWVKCYKDRAGVVTPANKGDYPFTKYNVKVRECGCVQVGGWMCTNSTAQVGAHKCLAGCVFIVYCIHTHTGACLPVQ